MAFFLFAYFSFYSVANRTFVYNLFVLCTCCRCRRFLYIMVITQSPVFISAFWTGADMTIFTILCNLWVCAISMRCFCRYYFRFSIVNICTCSFFNSRLPFKCYSAMACFITIFITITENRYNYCISCFIIVIWKKFCIWICKLNAILLTAFKLKFCFFISTNAIFNIVCTICNFSCSVWYIGYILTVFLVKRWIRVTIIQILYCFVILINCIRSIQCLVKTFQIFCSFICSCNNRLIVYNINCWTWLFWIIIISSCKIYITWICCPIKFFSQKTVWDKRSVIINIWINMKKTCQISAANIRTEWITFICIFPCTDKFS